VRHRLAHQRRLLLLCGLLFVQLAISLRLVLVQVFEELLHGRHGIVARVVAPGGMLLLLFRHDVVAPLDREDRRERCRNCVRAQRRQGGILHVSGRCDQKKQGSWRVQAIDNGRTVMSSQLRVVASTGRAPTRGCWPKQPHIGAFAFSDPLLVLFCWPVTHDEHASAGEAGAAGRVRGGACADPERSAPRQLLSHPSLSLPPLPQP